MQGDRAIRCSCGSLRGVARAVSGSRGNRVVCHCDDCQSFAHFLGRANEILDAQGGTEIFQMSPARLEILTGADRLACMRLTPTGLVRWYAECCGTPIGNTLITQQVPFVGLILACVEPGAAAGSRDAVLGPVRVHVQIRFAKGDRAQLHGRDRGTLTVMLRFAAMILWACLRGEQKASPFFDPKTGQTRAIPRVLSEPELREVERRRDAA